MDRTITSAKARGFICKAISYIFTAGLAALAVGSLNGPGNFPLFEELPKTYRIIFDIWVGGFVYLAAETGYKTLDRFAFRIDKRYYRRNLLFICFGTYESYYVMETKLNLYFFWYSLLVPLGAWWVFQDLNPSITFGNILLVVISLYTAKCIIAGFMMTINTLVDWILFPEYFGKPFLRQYQDEFGFPCYGWFGIIFHS